MSDAPIAERRQYRLDHIRAADAFDGSIADYARAEGLKPKQLYSWKRILARRGLLGAEAAAENMIWVRSIRVASPTYRRSRPGLSARSWVLLS